MLDIADPVEAYNFDRAVSLFGSALQYELEHVKGKTDKAQKAARERVIQKWIPEANVPRAPSNFRDPARPKA